ncbi:hypothetical protein NEIRO03_1277 [Nematocida sp. AWRm78]|nr:hypothetical protein NEIRO02_0571 [Nematocida sp. AWRm79]KAI5183701.1 hypothetical protein NEIRO03_1277 [Nematocida sp. AWRm78]
MKISKIIIIKRKAIFLVIWYMWVRASNEEDLYILNGMDDSINNNCTSADIYNSRFFPLLRKCELLFVITKKLLY